MHRTNAVPVAISVFAIAVGALFAAAATVGLPMLAAAPPGAYRLLAVSAVLAAGGALFLVKSMRGDLVPDGKSHRQIRLEAVDRIDSESLLAKIAMEDPYPDVREKARERLEERVGS